MFCKLAARNVRRSFRDYGVYLLTLTFGVGLFYTFNSLDGQSAMVFLGQNGNPIVASIFVMMDVFSVFVSVVLACLILYANNFLLRRRKRELGTYLLLGLSQGQVSLILFLETGIVGIISLILGLLVGFAASQGLSALTLSMFSIHMAEFEPAFSMRALGKTILYFGIIFLIVMLFSGVQVSKAKLIDLMQGERKNEELRQRPLRVAVIQLVLGVVCLAAAYAILLTFGMAIAIAVLPVCVVMLSLGTIGSLLIFKSLSGFVMKFAQGNPRFYFTNLNLFTLRQWLSRVHTTYLSQTVICILLLLSIGITASCIGLNSTIEGNTDEQAPFDITVQNQSGDVELVDFRNLIPQDLLEWQYDALFYYNDPEITGVHEASAAVRVTDYNALLQRQGLAPYTGELPYLQEDYSEALVTGSLGLTWVVVSDETAQSLDIRRQIWCADYAVEPSEAETQILPLVQELQNDVAVRAESRLNLYADLMGSKILVLFLGLYLGFTFLLSAAAVLALQQLSQAADNTGRYHILRRLGAEEKMVARSATQQVALAFLIPLGLALVHSIVGMKAANDIIAEVGKVDTVHSTVVTTLMLLLVYGGYFLATSLTCRRMACKQR